MKNFCCVSKSYILNCCTFTNKDTLSIPNEYFRCNFTERYYREGDTLLCVSFARNCKPHSCFPVIISLRRTIHGNRIWEEGARITHSVIFRSTALGTLANVFWNTRRAYLPWHECHGVSFISPRCQKFYASSSRFLYAYSLFFIVP